MVEKLWDLALGAYDCVVTHYSEIALKGKNRPFFEKKLVENIRKALKDESIGEIRRTWGRIIVDLNAKSDVAKINSSLAKVFGIEWFAPAYVTSQEVDSISRTVLEKSKNLIKEDTTIKVFVKRSDKEFPLTSMELSREIGARLVKEYGLKASMRNPTLKVFVEIADGKSYVFFQKIRGLGGLPVGVTGKVLCLLSGGIDSAVAAWLVMKRGCSADFLHFHPFRKNEEAINSKISELIRVLTQYSFKSRAHFIPATPFQFFTLNVPPRYDLVVFRRFMLRVAERIAKREGLKAIVTGDSLGQVASQTLENLSAIEDSTSLPIFRPLLTYDKKEIIDIARKIGTYAISIKPYKDCCSMIARHPATRAKAETVKKFEEKIAMEKLIEESLNLAETVEFQR
jgi:thiamine biosynthesis protein ThiI